MKVGSNARHVFVTSALVFWPVVPSQAEDTTTFVIAAASGYGIEDCLGQGAECGQVVADAWCQAHGQGGALKFGHEINEATLSIKTAPYFLTCGK